MDIRHYLNPLHVYCRFKDCGVFSDEFIIVFICKYDRHYKSRWCQKLLSLLQKLFNN
jgi:hypothetical protein